jgi:hypothetical protein
MGGVAPDAAIEHSMENVAPNTSQSSGSLFLSMKTSESKSARPSNGLQQSSDSSIASDRMSAAQWPFPMAEPAQPTMPLIHSNLGNQHHVSNELLEILAAGHGTAAAGKKHHRTFPFGGRT